MSNEKENIDVSELFSDLERSLGDLSCFVSTPTRDLVAEQVENLGDVITKARSGIAFLEKRLNEFGQEKTNSKQTELAERLSRHKSSFRKLLLDSKKKSDQFQQGKLLEGGSVDVKEKRIQSKKNTAARAAASITEGLKRTSVLLESEIKKSATSYQALAESSKMLQETRQAYGLITDVMQQSRTLLSGLEWSELVDYLVLCVGFFIFSSTVAYVLSKRTYLPIPSPLSFFYLAFYFFRKSWHVMVFFWQCLFGLTSKSQVATPAPSSFASAPTHVSTAVKYGVCPAMTFSAQFTHPTCGLTPS